MNQVVPPSLLFQFQPTIPRLDEMPRKKGGLLQLPDSAEIFVPNSLNRPNAGFLLRAAWNKAGLGIGITVSGKKMPVAGRREGLEHSDAVQLMIDTRHTASVHRATAYCTSLTVLPVDEQNGRKPTLIVRDIAQQREQRSSGKTEAAGLQCELIEGGYRLEIWLPAEMLYGFDESPEIGRIGFYCVVRDSELGELPLNVGGDFPIAFDPSTWMPLEFANA